MYNDIYINLLTDININLLPGIDNKLVTKYADFNKVGNKLKMANFTKGGRGKKHLMRQFIIEYQNL